MARRNGGGMMDEAQETGTQAMEQPEAEAPAPYVVVLKVGGNELDDETFLFGLVQAVRP